LRRRALPACLGAIAVFAVAAPMACAEDSFDAQLRARARSVAERTYVRVHNFGRHSHRVHRVRLHLRGQEAFTVKADDGSLFTAFTATVDSADGTGDAVLLFDELHFVRWASNRLAGNASVARQGNDIIVRYAVYRGQDSICCPSSQKPVVYRWTGTGVEASGKAPLVFGHQGLRLHLRRAEQ
jgi:hypothetical protein